MTDQEMELIFKTATDLTLSLTGKPYLDDPKGKDREVYVKRTTDLFNEIATELKAIHSKLKN